MNFVILYSFFHGSFMIKILIQAPHTLRLAVLGSVSLLLNLCSELFCIVLRITKSVTITQCVAVLAGLVARVVLALATVLASRTTIGVIQGYSLNSSIGVIIRLTQRIAIGFLHGVI